MKWTIHHKPITASTNTDALAGYPGDVFTADFQTSGKGRLNHTWHSSNGRNLIMSVVLDVKRISASQTATFPLVAGLAVVQGCERLLNLDLGRCLKWPNDVLPDGRKLSGILCRLNEESLIVGIGVNVNETNFPADLYATSLKILSKRSSDISIESVRDSILNEMADLYDAWKTHGFAAAINDIRRRDFLNGRALMLRQTDNDSSVITGFGEGISDDGAILLNGQAYYAGEVVILK